jgi:acyl carrier protein
MTPELRTLAADIFDVGPEEIQGDLGPGSWERWDSLGHLRLVTAVEEEFGVKLSMQEIQTIASLDALDVLIRERRG